MADDMVMRECCADCAFRPGTVARRTPLQPEKAQLCVELGIPFHCHEHPETPGATDAFLCKGFVDAFAVKVHRGDYDRLPEWERKVFLTLIDAVDKAEDVDKAGGGEMPDVLAMVRELLAGGAA